MKKIVLSSIVVSFLGLGFSGCAGNTVTVDKKAKVALKKVEVKKSDFEKSNFEKDNISANPDLLKEFKINSFDEFLMFRYCNIYNPLYKSYRSDIYNLFRVKTKQAAVNAFNNLDEIGKLNVIIKVANVIVNNGFTDNISGNIAANLKLKNGPLHKSVVAYMKYVNQNNKGFMNMKSGYDGALYISTAVSDISNTLNDIESVKSRIDNFTEKKTNYFQALVDFSKLTEIEKNIVRK